MNYQFYQPFSGVVRHLIIINALMYAATYLLLGDPHYELTEDGRELADLGRMQLAAFIPGSTHFQPYQILTHMFMHGDIMHLAFNMLSLYFFGPMVEMVFGHKRFLFYYLFCGIGSYVLYNAVQYWELSSQGIDPMTFDGPMLGASGAIFGIYVAFAYHFPNQVMQLLFPPVALKAKYFVLIMAGLELYYGVRGYATGVAHYAHLGGALFGFAILMYWNNFRFRN